MVIIAVQLTIFRTTLKSIDNTIEANSGYCLRFVETRLTVSLDSPAPLILTERNGYFTVLMQKLRNTYF